jgi:hypothetical protein|nr:MAG TPA: hypothetical protein [Caudoviricetes sp.]
MYGISNSQQQGGGGGSAASYKAIKSTLTPSDWQEVAGATPYFIGENAMQWTVNGDGDYEKSQTTKLGLVAGNSYTITAVCDGQTYTQTAVAAGDEANGIAISYDLHPQVSMFVDIYDDNTGSKCVIYVEATSFVITKFEGEGFGSGCRATISDSAIKVNSAVTLYTNTSEKIAVGEKTNGNVTLIADSIPVTSIPYSLEIVGTDTEGLFELINGYIPPTIEVPTALPQKTSAIKTGTLPKGGSRVEITDSEITATSDIVVDVSYKKKVTGGLAPGMLALVLSNGEVADEDISFEYKIKQTDGEGQFTVVNSYIPQQILPLEKNVTNESTSLGQKVVTITGTAKPYLFTVKDSDVSASVFVRLYPADENTETWLNEHTLSSIITEESHQFTFKVDTNTLPTTFSIKYIIETLTK